MSYAHPGECPDCHTVVGASATCPRCRLDLTSPEVATVRQALASADAWLARAPRAAVPAVSEPAASAPADRLTEGLPSLPRRAASAPTRQWTAGGVILALGAACLVISGLIFLGVAWGSIGATGRASILLVVTAIVGLVADRCTVRRLRASALTFWTVFLGLVTVDWFVGRALGFAGLDAIRADVAVGIWSALMLVAALGVGLRSQRVMEAPLAIMTFTAGAVPFAAGPAVGAAVWSHVEWPFWPMAAAAIVSAAVLLVVRWTQWRLSVILAGIAALFFGTVATVSAFVQAVLNPDLRDLVVDRDGLPLALVAVTFVLAAAVTRQPVARILTAALATFTVASLVVIPSGAAGGIGGGWLSVAALVVIGATVTAVPGSARVRASFRGVQIVVVAAWFALAAMLLPWLGVVIDVLAQSAVALTRVSAGEDLTSQSERPFNLGVMVLVAAALAASVAAFTRWAGGARWASLVARGASVAFMAVALAVVCDAWPRPWTVAAVLVVGALALTVIWRGDRAWSPVGPAVLVLTPAFFLSAQTTFVVVAPAVAAALAVISMDRRARDHAFVTSLWCGVATAWLGLTVATATDLSGASYRGISLATVIAAGVALAAAVAMRPPAARRGVEGGAIAVVGVGVLVAAWMTPDVREVGWVALVLTVPGAVASAVAILVPDRRGYVFLASPLLGVAWVLRLIASDIRVVEVYTAPFALALLGAGVIALMRRPAVSSRVALTPGVALTLVPSLPQALDEPTSTRAAILAAVSVAFLGVGLARRWQAPFLGGSGVVALLLLVNVGPYAWAVPRWVVIAAVGTLLTAVGMTWEQRVRDGRSAAQFLSTMR